MPVVQNYSRQDPPHPLPSTVNTASAATVLGSMENKAYDNGVQLHAYKETGIELVSNNDLSLNIHDM